MATQGRSRTRRVVVAAFVASSLVAAGCGGGGDPAPGCGLGASKRYPGGCKANNGVNGFDLTCEDYAAVQESGDPNEIGATPWRGLVNIAGEVQGSGNDLSAATASVEAAIRGICAQSPSDYQPGREALAKVNAVAPYPYIVP